MKNRLSVTGKAASTAAEGSESTTRTAPAVERNTESGTGLYFPDEASVFANPGKTDQPACFTLQNGLQVVVIPDHRTPVVTQMIWYKVGSADEPPGKSGLAHFLEHLMFKGHIQTSGG
ncbi:hypothetical protein ABH973_003697 [Bradyrhizobium ottawaense]